MPSVATCGCEPCRTRCEPVASPGASCSSWLSSDASGSDPPPAAKILRTTGLTVTGSLQLLPPSSELTAWIDVSSTGTPKNGKFPENGKTIG